MIPTRLSDVVQPLGAQLIGADGWFSGVSSDSRTLAQGELFLALSGANFDGHKYLDEAARRGAAGALVSRPCHTSLPCLRVENSLTALAQLAAWHRARCPAKVIAITGSNGKTTVKEWLGAILAPLAPTLATQGNLNNHIGLPLTLLKLAHEAFAVVEMGANHGGEIAQLSRIARPDLAILNNAGRAHLEGFGSLEGVARAKGEIALGLKAGGTLIFNADDPWADYWRGLPGDFDRLGFGLGDTAEVRGVVDDSGHFTIHTRDWQQRVELPLPGDHNRSNALAAAAAAWRLGVTGAQLRQGLEALRPVPGRLEPLAGRNGLRLINDTYNANPDSVIAAIRHLASQPGRRLFALGELAELGDETDHSYRELGLAAREAGLDALWAVEPAGAAADAFGAAGQRFGDVSQLLDFARDQLRGDEVLLVKGSRRAAMERLVQGLTKEGDC